MRRPPGEGRSVVSRVVLAAVILIIPWLVEAQQQPVQAVRPRYETAREVLEADPSSTFAATRILQQQLETPLNTERRKNTFSVRDHHHPYKNDASALALAPADAAVRAPSSGRPSHPTAGLSSSQPARSLEDWEVEDFVLLATVDGKLHARDRRTGKAKWALEVDKPMVETTYYKRNRSSVDEEYDPVSIDDYLWIVEPSNDGSIYIYRPHEPNPGLVNTGLTMKRLVEEMAPYADDDPPILYTGEKRTTMITIDAQNGKVLKWFGTSGAVVNDESCLRPSGPLNADNEECDASATLTIGRTEYSVGILGKKDGHMIASLKFSEWGPNNYDADLQRQYITSLDNRYIHTSHDGSVIGFDHGRGSVSENDGKFFQKLSAPVVRVFDVARPWGTEDTSPELIILPQPLAPGEEDDVERAKSIFLNHTEDGSWYALSGKSYPWAVRGSQQARIQQQGWQQHGRSWERLNDKQISEALVGRHMLETSPHKKLLTISSPNLDENTSDAYISDQAPTLAEDQTILKVVQQFPAVAANSFLEFIKNPVLIIFIIGLLLSNQRKVRTWVGQTAGNKIVPLATEDAVPPKLGEVPALPKLEEEAEVAPPEPQPPVLPAVGDTPVSLDVEKSEKSSPEPEKSVVTEESPEKPSPEKKKAHRGRRGGVKHKKGPKNPPQESSDDGKPRNAQPTVEDAVRDAKKMGEQPKLEPDIRTISHDPTEVSGPIIRVGQLEVNTDKLIGTGSNGTMVFEGNFDGRAVAVKRMLIQFFDIASQETKLLRESDDHPNGELYLRQRQRSFLTHEASHPILRTTASSWIPVYRPGIMSCLSGRCCRKAAFAS